MKRSDLLKIILGFLLGGIGLMLYRSFTVPDMPELASSSNLVVERGGTATLIVEVEDGCTANWYSQEIGGDPIKENATTYKFENLEDSTVIYAEAVLEKNSRKVSKKRLKIEVKVKESASIAEVVETPGRTVQEPVVTTVVTTDGGDGSEVGNYEPELRDDDQDGVMSDVDKNDHEAGPIENNGVPYIIDLMIKQQSDPNKFTINPKFWDAITNNEVQIKYTCLECGENPLLTTIYRNDTYGIILMGSNMNYNGALGTIKVLNFNLKKYYKLKDSSNNYKTPKGLSCKGY